MRVNGRGRTVSRLVVAGALGVLTMPATAGARQAAATEHGAAAVATSRFDPSGVEPSTALVPSVLVPPEPAPHRPDKPVASTAPEPAPVAPIGEGSGDLDLSDVITTPVSGQAAVDALGARLDAVAARHGWSGATLRTNLHDDATLTVDSTGALMYVDPVLPPAVPTTRPVSRTASKAAAATAGALAAPFPYSQTFQLHSAPGSSKVIYLDFDGHTVSGTVWNTTWNLPAGTYAGYSQDASPAFSNVELDAIQGMWQRVAEDFAIFDVDVTTQDPGFDAINRSSAADTNYGTRAFITSDPSVPTIICSNTCAGQADKGAFDNTTNHAFRQPAMVMAAATGNAEALVAGTISHEIGHTLGLSHDGISGGEEYYQGQGPWAPIMGNNKLRPVTQFSKGDYISPSNTEDDFWVMRGHGVTLRPDDHSLSVLASPTPLTMGLPRRGSGLIREAADVDAFSFVNTCAGAVTIQAIPSSPSPNLDIVLTLYDAGGTMLQVADPKTQMITAAVASGMDATIVANLIPARYLIDVTGAELLPFEDGYTDYGSVGRYDIEVSGCSGIPPDNDDFANAAVITGRTGSVSYSNANATVEFGEPGGSGVVQSSWVRWTAPFTGTARVDTRGSNFDTYLCAYTGTSVAALTGIGCDDDSGGNVSSQIDLAVVAGTTYRFQVDGYNAFNGMVSLAVRPGNDGFANAFVLSGVNGSGTSTTEAASAEPGEPPASLDANTVWWAWIAPSTGLATFDTYGSAVATHLCVYTGAAVDALTTLGCDDDSAVGLWSAVQINVTAGTVYRIQVDGWSVITGDVVARARMPMCAGAVVTVDLHLDQVPTEGDDVILGTSGGDSIFAAGGNDKVCAGAGADTVFGEAGADVMLPGPGDDRVVGGTGADTINYADVTGTVGIQIDLSRTTAQYTGPSGNETVSQVENATGSKNRDLLTGSAARNTLNGGAGDDQLSGLAHIDKFIGGSGTDFCDGGEGTDVHVSGCENLTSVP